MTDEEIRDSIANDIRDMLEPMIGKKANCEDITNNVTAYLVKASIKLSFPKTPIVRVENEGPFITVNFFDDKGNRLETLEEMLGYMNNVVL